MYQRYQISADIEKDIITGLIVDEYYGKQVLSKMLKLEHFSSKYLRRIASWVFDYYIKYDCCPFTDIQSIFDYNKKSLKQDESDLIEVLLQDISDQYKESSGVFNTQYLIDKTIQHCQSKNLQILMDEVDDFLIKGKVDQALSLVVNFNQVASTTSKWIDVFDEREVDKTFIDEERDKLFRLPGRLGDLVGGYLRRDWLISYMGPAKRGKSYRILEDITFEALTCGLKVAYVSLEMSDKDVKKRVYSRISAGAKHEGPITIPIFDCLRNQDGSCDRPERINKVVLNTNEDDEKGVPSFDEDVFKTYIPCTYCRMIRQKDYIPAIWYTIHEAQKISLELIKDKIKTFKMMFKNNLKVISYPPFGANFDEIIADVDVLEYTQKFVADVLVIDYFDIMGDEPGAYDQRGQIDARWKKGKALAKKRHCLVATVSQSGRASFVKDNLDEEDTSEDIRKMAHADLYIGINQTRKEKAIGMVRINIMAYRHDDFNFLSQVIVLQSLKIGQPFLDAEYGPKTYKKIYGSKNNNIRRRHVNNR